MAKSDIPLLKGRVTSMATLPPPVLDPISTLTPDLQQKFAAAQTQHTQDEANLAAIMPELRRVAGLDPSIPAHPPSTVERNDRPHDFRPQLVEPLLLQASQLLGSLVATQRVYRQLRTQQINLAADVTELPLLKQINDDEVAAKIYDVPYWEARSALDSNNIAVSGSNNTATFLTTQQADQQLNAAWAAENAEIPFSVNASGSGVTIGNHKSSLQKQPAAPVSGSVEATIFGTSVPTNGATLGALLAYREASYSFQYAVAQLGAQSDPITVRSPYYTSRASYLAADASFRERRRDAAFNKLVYKLSALNQPHGPLDYADQISTLLLKATNDFQNTYVRLQVARQGMKLIFNHESDPLPIQSEISTFLPSKYLNDLVEWTRRTVLVLNRLSVNDQPYVHRVALRTLLGAAEFDAGHAARSWKFHLDKKDFAHMCFLRMRGISLWVMGEMEVPAGFMVVPPRETINVYKDGVAIRSVQRLHPCPIGRPLRWSLDNLQMDINGTNVLYNGSPLGTWEVYCIADTDPKGIENIVLDIYLQIQTADTAAQ
jgi:hypothetical protein